MLKEPLKLVTVALPVYKRLDFLSKAVQSVASQDYPHIELIVSDNGMNGTRIPEIVKQNYPRPFRFRQEPATVPLVAHFNHILQDASGHYYVMLCDDDEISPTYVSELVAILQADPKVALAFAKQEVVDFSGRVIRTSSAHVPERMTGEDFIRMWCTGQHGFKSWVTFLGRTEDMRACGGFLDTPYGNQADNALVTRLCLGNQVAFNQRCVFRNRSYEESSGISCGCLQFAEDTRLFLRFLDSDPHVCAFASAQPHQWARSKELLIKMAWETYHIRWATLYRRRLSRSSWLRAAFALPFIPAYYRAVSRTLADTVKAMVSLPARKYLPRTYRAYRTLRYGRSV